MSEEFREITLTKGQFAIVDAVDYEYLMRWKWYARRHRNTFYAERPEKLEGGGTRVFKMHRVLIQAPDGVLVDHRNRCGLDNRRVNLRLADSSQNGANRDYSWRRRGNMYRGVYLRRSGRWTATVRHRGVLHCAGTYDTAEQAAVAFDGLAAKLHGDFAMLNFPPIGGSS